MQIQRVQEVSAKPLLIIIGSDDLGRSLAHRLIQNWRISVFETAPVERGLYPAGVSFHQGSATDSRALRQAGVDTAGAVLAATDDDHLNLEVCRLCGEFFGVPRRFTFLNDPRMAEEAKLQGIEVIARVESLALAAESRVQKGVATASGVGLGRGEIYQVEVLEGSTAIGKTPRMLNPQSWLLAAIYRGEDLIVPHGDTEIRVGDRVLLVGQPEILAGVANFFRAGTSEFPLQYGAKLLALGYHGFSPTVEAELRYLNASTESRGAVFVVGRPWQPSSTEDDLPTLVEPDAFTPRRMAKVLDRLDSGCCVLEAPAARWWHQLGLGARSFRRSLELHSEPVLVSRGTHPYNRIVLGVKPGRGARFAAEMAVDLCRGLGAKLLAVAALPSPLVSGEGYREELEAALREVDHLGEIYGLEVETRLEYGNPVHIVVNHSRESDLLVVSHRVGRPFSLTGPDVSRHLLLRSSCSVLCLPHRY